MKKILFLFISCILPLSYCFGEEDDNRSVYFCTKDLDALRSVAKENKENIGTTKDEYCVHKEISNNVNLKFRHCFLLLAQKIKVNDKFYYLKTDQAPFGYGSEESGLLTPKRGTARAEEIEPGTTIACAPVLDKKDIKGKLFDGADEEDMFYWWTKIQNLMNKDAKTADYDTFKHNCCTVAFDAIKKVDGHLERINFSNFNEGYGTINRDGLSLLEFLGLSGKVSSEISKASANKWIFKASVILPANSMEERQSGAETSDCNDKHDL